MPEDQSYVWELPGDERARGMARLLVEGVLLPAEPVTREHVGELAARVVDDAVAAGDTCVLTIELAPMAVTVTVGGAGARILPGLGALEELASAWGMQASRSGRAVWFQVPRQRVDADGTVPS